MKWCMFLFWFIYRFILACLAHFNWCMAIYTNCIYFPLWKSYDLLWFWMHLVLCSCFPQLRSENYLVVWSNLIWSGRTKYPDMTYKQIYLTIYGNGKMNKAERKLERMDTVEKGEAERRRLRAVSGGSSESDTSSSSSSSGEDVAVATPQSEQLVQSTSMGPIPPPRLNKHRSVENGNTSDSEAETSKWMKKVPAFLRRKKDQKKPKYVAPKQEKEEDGLSTWAKIRGVFPKRAPEPACSKEVYVLTPDYSNIFDEKNPKTAARREKRDRKALTKRVRDRIREELKVQAKKERRRRLTSDAIELLLQLLRMLASFMILVGNIRKTFIPAQFKYLKPGQHPYDNYELLLLFRCFPFMFSIFFYHRFTTFLDISMFWANIMWVHCLQWHLCVRLGCFKFWSWLVLLTTIAMVVMIIPMGYAMNEMDLSWCVFLPESPLSKYQPSW